MTRLTGWGRYPVIETELSRARDESGVLAALAGDGGLIARGNGRAYGDSAIGGARTLDMRGMDRMLAFDPATGQLIAEAGVLLSDIIAIFLPRGWFPQVTPGTRHVTLGGMIAADVHGKNHEHQGSMRSCIDWLDLAGPDGLVRRCSPHDEAELFEHSIGGMGLTGVILRAAIRLRRVETGWIRQRRIAARNLDEAMALFDAHADASYSVAWIDCLSGGRSLLELGEHATLSELPPERRAQPFDIGVRQQRSVPFDFPAFALNRLSVRLFNAAWYRLGKRSGGRPLLVGWDQYFYPLDAIGHWNRIYGRRGFVQFQCVLPLATAHAGLHALLGRIAAAGGGSFLTTLKKFGPQVSPFSFPMAGYTLALDFPVSAANFALVETLEGLTVEHGGRLYLAKDARMSAATLRATDPRTGDFTAFRARHGLRSALASAQSERLEL